MGINYKVMRDFLLLKKSIEKKGMPFNVASFGYMDLNLSVDQAKVIFGDERLSKCRVSPYRHGIHFGLHHIPYPKFLAQLEAATDPRSLSHQLNANDYHGNHQLWFELLRSFSLLGCNCQVFDLFPHRGVETIADLTKPIRGEFHQLFDVIIDGGTTEHCLAPDRVFENIVDMLRIGGVVMHILPMNFRYHGYYNFDPTLFYDFYTAKGFDVLYCSYSKENGLRRLPERGPQDFLPSGSECIWFYAQKTERKVRTNIRHTYFLLPQAYTWGPLLNPEAIAQSTLPNISLWDETADSMYSAIIRNLKGLCPQEEFDEIRANEEYKADPYLLQSRYEDILLRKTDEYMERSIQKLAGRDFLIVVACPEVFKKWNRMFPLTSNMLGILVMDMFFSGTIEARGIAYLPAVATLANNPEIPVVLFGDRKSIGRLWRRVVDMHPKGADADLIPCWR